MTDKEIQEIESIIGSFLGSKDFLDTVIIAYILNERRLIYDAIVKTKIKIAVAPLLSYPNHLVFFVYFELGEQKRLLIVTYCRCGGSTFIVADSPYDIALMEFSKSTEDIIRLPNFYIIPESNDRILILHIGMGGTHIQHIHNIENSKTVLQDLKEAIRSILQKLPSIVEEIELIINPKEHITNTEHVSKYFG